ncbi:MAG: family 20 glycosylhydrolase [Christensenella sp.]
MLENLFTVSNTAGSSGLNHRLSLPADKIIKQIINKIPTSEHGEFNQIIIETDVSLAEDSFSITSQDGQVIIKASNRRAEIYAAYSLLQQSQHHPHGHIQKGYFLAQPVCPYRGLKLYLPAPDNLEAFYKMIDMLCYYRYNTVVLEIGGAMEYKNHPEINKAWIEYCIDMASSPNRANEVQTAQAFDKNSIHFENGGGQFLTQSVIKNLLSYCRERGLEVIPEVPCLSHSDYILQPHRELAERPEDPYPDCYCPSNPKSYELLFEIMDEVIEVFNPTVMHIGHDEYYSIGVCAKCKGKSGADIYADDVNKICDYLREKKIRPMLWAEKLLNASINNEIAHGGAERYDRLENGETVLRRPATWQAIEKMPKELLAMHWYWSIREDLDNEFILRKIPFVYGNFNSVAFPDWNRRVKAGALGASPSHWSSLEEDTLQRNGVLLSLVYASYMFWSADYKDNQYEQLLQESFEELFLYCNREILATSYLEFVHTTTIFRPYVYISSLPMQLEKDTIGFYIVHYEDGTEIKVPIIYGKNITNSNRFWKRGFRMNIPEHKGVGDSDDELDGYTYDTLLAEVSYTTLPTKLGSETQFRFVVKNPHPSKAVVKIEVIKSCEDNGQIILKAFSAHKMKGD